MSDAGTGNSVWRGWLLRAVGSGVILAVLFWFLPIGDVVAGFAKVSPVLFGGVLVVFLLGHFASAAKWWNLLDRKFPFIAAVRAHFAGLASNLCLPGAAGGDAVRAAVAQMSIGDGAKVISGSVADRLIDMLALACLSLGGILMLSDSGGGAVLALKVLGLMLVLLAAAVFMVPRVVPMIWNAAPGLPAKGLALRTAASFGELAKRPGLLLTSFVLSAAIQCGFILLTVQLANAIGVTAPLGAWFFAWPLAKILAVLPVSLNGLGVREATLAGLLAPFGALAPEVVASGLVWQAVLFVAGGLGALVLMVSGAGFGAVQQPSE